MSSSRDFRALATWSMSPGDGELVAPRHDADAWKGILEESNMRVVLTDEIQNGVGRRESHPGFGISRQQGDLAEEQGELGVYR